MSGFDYNAPAELFPRRNKARPKRPVAYRRFTTATEAIRFAIEKHPIEHLAGAILEVNEERDKEFIASAKHWLQHGQNRASAAAPHAVATLPHFG